MSPNHVNTENFNYLISKTTVNNIIFLLFSFQTNSYTLNIVIILPPKPTGKHWILDIGAFYPPNKHVNIECLYYLVCKPIGKCRI